MVIKSLFIAPDLGNSESEDAVEKGEEQNRLFLPKLGE